MSGKYVVLYDSTLKLNWPHAMPLSNDFPRHNKANYDKAIFSSDELDDFLRVHLITLVFCPLCDTRILEIHPFILLDK